MNIVRRVSLFSPCFKYFKHCYVVYLFNKSSKLHSMQFASIDIGLLHCRKLCLTLALTSLLFPWSHLTVVLLPK